MNFQFSILNSQFKMYPQREHSEWQAHSFNSGQALLEVLVALATAVIIASAFVSLGAISVRNSKSSSNQAKATQFAQEGIEAAISIRDQNTIGAVQNMGSINRWAGLYGTTFPCATPADLSTNCDGDFMLTQGGAAPCDSQWCIARDSSTYTASGWQVSSSRQFSRKVRITDPVSGADTIKNITIFVWWTDASGRHESVLSRKLYVNPLL